MSSNFDPHFCRCYGEDAFTFSLLHSCVSTNVFCTARVDNFGESKTQEIKYYQRADILVLVFQREGLTAEGGGTHIRLSTLELAPVLRSVSFLFYGGRVRATLGTGIQTQIPPKAGSTRLS